MREIIYKNGEISFKCMEEKSKYAKDSAEGKNGGRYKKGWMDSAYYKFVAL